MTEIAFFEEIYQKYTCERYLNRNEILLRIQRIEFNGNFNELWEAIISRRKQEGRKITLKDQHGNHFWYVLTPSLEKKIHDINFVAKRNLDEIVAKEVYKQVLLEEMIIDEAFYSSVIEGAFSTKKRTKELVKSGNPKNKSEQMILNNYYALLFILENLDKELNEEIFINIHKIITQNTLEEDEITERYRDDQVYVTAYKRTEPIYTPPKAENVEPMMVDLFNFINNKSEAQFIPPIIKAFIIHFYIGCVHPFFDGNGRIARAFSYMYLLKEGYDFFKFFSISSIINKHRGKYYKSFKDTEDFDSDLTYFIASHADITLESISDVIQRLNNEINNELLRETLEKGDIFLSERQKKFLRFINKKESNLTTIEEYKERTKVSYETARRDLTELEQLGLFKKVKKGKKFIFKYLGLKGYMEQK